MVAPQGLTAMKIELASLKVDVFQPDAQRCAVELVPPGNLGTVTDLALDPEGQHVQGAGIARWSGGGKTFQCCTARPNRAATGRERHLADWSTS
jgi:hypothetical protein